jgi:hypothetical protein
MLDLFFASRQCSSRIAKEESKNIGADIVHRNGRGDITGYSFVEGKVYSDHDASYKVEAKGR